jgi:murein DD-endopeptidase MepM/ murein hydrolase activator NlpD
LIATALLAVLGLVAGFALAQPAYAVDYPSWQDVQNAKANEAAKNAQVQKIQGLIAGLQAEVEATQAEAEKKGAEYQIAQQKFDEADILAQNLTAQAQASAEKAKTASTQAGRLAAQLYRSGGSDLSMNLLMQKTADGSDKLLQKLGSMSKMVERSNAIYAQAQTAKNEAESLSKQAEVAKTAREELRVQAETAMNEAIAANEAANAKLAESEQQSAILEAQLAALKDATAQTVAGYQAGVEERKRQEEARRAAAAAAAAAALAAQGITISNSGWTHPAPGYGVTSDYGWRSMGDFHLGTDIGSRCGSPLYAVTSGTVTYAGWQGSYGNLIRINHGGGVSTGYAHISPGGIMVSVGQQVAAGQQIATTGTTGNSTGCHLHFEVRLNGSTTNPRSFMADRGVGF